MAGIDSVAKVGGDTSGGTFKTLIVAPNYPSPVRPYYGTFIQQFAWSLARQGNNCIVVNPVSIFDRRFGVLPPFRSVEQPGSESGLSVLRPRFVSCGSRPLGFTHTGRWSQWLFKRAALGVIARFAEDIDVVYGHFLYPGGATAIRAARRLDLPSVVGVGEGEFWSIRAPGLKMARGELKEATAFLAVSSEIERKLRDELEIPSSKIRLFPNGVDRHLFHLRNRAEMCKRFNIPEETFNIAFVGGFTVEKGFPQLLQAIKGLSGVRIIALGRDAYPIENESVAFVGSVTHNQVAEIIGAADAFVLPTGIEGSCNAVIEAMACGLPIITSDGLYMDDIVDDEVAIRVNPRDIEAIRRAILALKEDPVRRARMAQAALARAEGFDIDDRARRVTVWMKELAARGRI